MEVQSTFINDLKDKMMYIYSKMITKHAECTTIRYPVHIPGLYPIYRVKMRLVKYLLKYASY